MVYFFSGDDGYAKWNEARKIATDQNSLFLSYDFQKKEQWESFRQQVTTPFLFGQEYLFYLKEFDSVSIHVQTNVYPLVIREFSKKTVTVIIDVKSNSPVLKGELPFPVFPYDLPKPWKRAEWIDKVLQQAKKLGIQLKHDQAEFILDRCGTSPAKFDNELKKLQILAERGKITDTLLRELVYPYQPENLDDFIFSLLSKEYIKVIRTLTNTFDDHPENLILFQIIKAYLNLTFLHSFYKKQVQTFQELSEISKSTALNIPTLSRFYGFSFGNEKHGKNVVQLYDERQLNVILEELWAIDYNNKTEGKSIFYGLIEFINHRTLEDKNEYPIPT